MAQQRLPIEQSGRTPTTLSQPHEDADFADPRRRELLRRLSFGAMLAALGTPLWLRGIERASARALGPAAAANSGLPVPYDTDVDIKGAYASKSILALIGAATGIAAAGFGFAAFPVVGLVLGVVGAVVGLVGALVGIFWNPAPGQVADSIWSLIQARVQNLINVTISNAEFDALSGAIDGLKDNLLDYVALVKQHKLLGSAQSLEELRQKYTAVDTYCIGVREQFLPEGSESRFLVLFAQFANLHHMLLQDMVLNGKAYGVEPGLTAADVEKLARTVARNCATFDHFWEEFLDRCAASRSDNTFGATHVVFHGSGADGEGREDYKGWVEDGLYDRNRAVSDSIAQVTTLAKDYRDLWPCMGALRAGPVSLTRELWLGPFGSPDCYEFGGDFTVINQPGWGWWAQTGGYQAAQKPNDSPLAPLRGISIRQLSDPPYLRFPYDFTLLRVGDGQTPTPGAFWLSLSDADGGPASRVTVSLTSYFVADGQSQIPHAGRLVSQLAFPKANGTFTVGDTRDGGGVSAFAPGDPAHRDLDAKVDASHVLSGMHVNSHVTRLYGGNMNLANESGYPVGTADIPPGVKAIGSMMFGFRLKDPLLAPDADVLAAIRAANPELPPLGPDAAVDIVKRVRQAHGRSLPADEAAALRRQFERELADPALAERSTAFERMVDDRLAQWKAAVSP